MLLSCPAASIDHRNDALSMLKTMPPGHITWSKNTTRQPSIHLSEADEKLSGCAVPAIALVQPREMMLLLPQPPCQLPSHRGQYLRHKPCHAHPEAPASAGNQHVRPSYTGHASSIYQEGNWANRDTACSTATPQPNIVAIAGFFFLLVMNAAGNPSPSDLNASPCKPCSEHSSIRIELQVCSIAKTLKLPS